MLYESKEEAKYANPGSKTASEIVDELTSSFGYVMHPTNAGQDAAKLNSPYVEFKPLNQQGKPNKLYLKEGIRATKDSLIKKAKRRQAFGQDVFSRP